MIDPPPGYTGGGLGGGGLLAPEQLPASLGPQSKQSSQAEQVSYSAPSPPSSHSPSRANAQVFRHSPLPGGPGGGGRGAGGGGDFVSNVQ